MTIIRPLDKIDPSLSCKRACVRVLWDNVFQIQKHSVLEEKINEGILLALAWLKCYVLHHHEFFWVLSETSFFFMLDLIFILKSVLTLRFFFFLEGNISEKHWLFNSVSSYFCIFTVYYVLKLRSSFFSLCLSSIFSHSHLKEISCHLLPSAWKSPEPDP